MNEITSITPQAKDKTRCNIFLDGKFFCGLTLETVVKNRLKVGQNIEKEKLALMQEESEKQTALQKALNHISVSQKTEKEIRDYLTKKGYLENVSAYVIDKMRSYGYIDDESYAKSYAEFAVKKKGKKMIISELKAKGVSDAEISTATEELQGEEETAKRIAEKYMRGKTFDKSNLAKTYRYLLGKGFDYEIAKSAIQSLGEEVEE